MLMPILSKNNRVKRVPNKALAIHNASNSNILAAGELQEDTDAALDAKPDFPNDIYEIIRTPQEWHQEHLEFMNNGSPALPELDEAEEIEAATYFDQAHGRMVFCCTHCLEMLPWVSRMINHTHVCPKCGASQKGKDACRAAYLALLGIKHTQCTLSDCEFDKKTQGLEPFEFVQKYMDVIEQSKHNLNIAERRALNLMKHLFGERVYKQIVNNGETWVTGSDGLYYRLFWSRHGNVAVYEHRYKSQARRLGKVWKPIAAYCGHFGEHYPISDQIIAQICMIKTNPDRYTSQANKVLDEHLSNCGPDYLHKAMMGKIMEIQL